MQQSIIKKVNLKEEEMKSTSQFFFKNGQPDYSILDEKLKVLDNFSTVSNYAIYIRDLYNRDYPYLSSFPEYLTGYSQEELLAFGDNVIENLLVKEDLLAIEQNLIKINEQVYSIDPEDRKYIVITISQNFIHKDGFVVPVITYLTPFLFDDNNNVWMLLAKVTISHMKQNHSRFIYIDVLNKDERYQFNFSLGNFEIVAKPSLTHREKSVLVLSIRGYLDKEIADNLGLSVNTVKIHKRNFLKKMKVGSIKEAYISASIHKLI